MKQPRIIKTNNVIAKVVSTTPKEELAEKIKAANIKLVKIPLIQ